MCRKKVDVHLIKFSLLVKIKTKTKSNYKLYLIQKHTSGDILAFIGFIDFFSLVHIIILVELSTFFFVYSCVSVSFYIIAHNVSLNFPESLGQGQSHDNTFCPNFFSSNF